MLPKITTLTNMSMSLWPTNYKFYHTTFLLWPLPGDLLLYRFIDLCQVLENNEMSAQLKKLCVTIGIAELVWQGGVEKQVSPFCHVNVNWICSTSMHIDLAHQHNVSLSFGTSCSNMSFASLQGTLRVLLVLLHDFPEFLCDYHFSFCDVIPPNCIQMRNLILSAFPRNMRLPDPFTPNLKVL